MKRIMAFLLAVVMVVSMLPVSALAEDAEPVEAAGEITAPETEPVETEPSTEAGEPTETTPAETEPAATEPAETEPAETEPAETEPAETEPAETEPAETIPEETEEVTEEEDLEILSLLAKTAFEDLKEEDVRDHGKCGAWSDGSHLEWFLTNEGELYIVGVGDLCGQAPGGIMPWDKYTDEDIKAVYIQPGCTGIGYGAFEHPNNLVTVEIPDTVLWIGDRAFSNLRNLESITIPDSVREIGNGVFYNDPKLKEIIIGKNVTSIGERAFRDTPLESFTVPEELLSIGANAFEGCGNLKTVHVDSLEHWSAIDFANDKSHPFGDTRSSERHFFVDRLLISNLVIPETVEEIGKYAFLNCTEFTSVSFPENLKHIGEDAFKGCTAMERMYTNSVNSWVDVVLDSAGSHPFCDSKAAERKLYAAGELVTKVDILGGPAAIHDNAFRNCNCITSISIPTSVYSIGANVLYNCSNLKIIRIWRRSPMEINDEAFATVTAEAYHPTTSISWDTSKSYGGNLHWENGTFGWCCDMDWLMDENSTLNIYGSGPMNTHGNIKDATGYPWHTFRNAVKKLSFQEGITNITAGFTELANMTSVTLGSSVNHIDADAFRSAVSVSELHIGSLPSWLNIDFISFASNPLYSTTKPVDLYVNDKLVTEATIPDGVQKIPNHAFRNCERLISVTIPAGMNSIGYQAFIGCSGLRTIYFQGDLPSAMNSDAFTGINAVAFYPKGNTTYANVENYGGNIRWVEYEGDSTVIAQGECGKAVTWTLTTDGKMTIRGTGEMDAFAAGETPWNAFQKIIQTVEVQSGVTSVGSYAFAECPKLQSINLSESVESVGSYAFAECPKLQNVDLSMSMKTIGSYAFYKCANLNSVDLHYVLISIGDYAFSECPNLERIVAPLSLKTIGSYAFSKCSSLNAVILFNGVTSIGDYAFSECSSLESIDLPGVLKTIGSNAFSQCTGLESIVLPEDLETIGSNAFQGCTKLSRIEFRGGPLANGEIAFPDISATVICHLVQGWRPDEIPNLGNKLNWKINPGEPSDFTCTPDPLILNYLHSANPHDITVNLTYNDGTAASVRLDMLDGVDFMSPDTHTLGERVMALTIAGVRKEFLVYVRKSSYPMVTEGVPESEHPYPAGEYQEYTVKYEGAAGLRLTFSNETDLGDGTLTVVDVKNNVVATFTGTDAANQYVDISGDIATLKLQGGSSPVYGFRLKFVTADMHDHIYRDTVIPLTCTQDGCTKHVCVFCGDTQVENFEPAPGHSYEWLIDEKTHWYKCSTCGEATTPTPEAHEPDFETGLNTSVSACSVCGLKYTVISVSGPEALRGGTSGTYKAEFTTDAKFTKGGILWQLRPCDTAFASISTRGKLTTKAVGKPVEIRVLAVAKADPAFYTEYPVTLVPVARSVNILCGEADVTGGTLAETYEAGKVIQLSARIEPAVALQTGTWKSGASGVATITADGQVTFKKPGSAKFTFTAADGSKKTASVTIVCGTPAEGLSITGAKELSSGQRTTLTAAFTNAPTVKTVTWTSSDPTAAAVSGSGAVTAKTVYEEKTVTITAKANDGSGQTAEHTITVSPKPNVLGIRRDGKIVNEQTLMLNTSVKTVTLTAPEGTVWTSSKPKIAEVTDGVVTFKANGSTVITAKSPDGKQSGKVTLNRKALLTWIKIEFDQEYEPIVLPCKGKTTLRAINRWNHTPLKDVTWSSNKPDIATVSSSGVVTAKPGVTKETYVLITATAKDGGGESATVSVKVLPQTTVLNICSGDDYVTEDGIELSLFEILDGRTLTFKTGTSIRLNSFAYPDEKDACAPGNRTWKSSAPKIATVDSIGRVTSLKAGTVTITVTSVDGKTSSVKLKFV